ncbi:MAG: AbrB/MazE/SpoVT family DNA-binding domain-containing protein [Candidatus Eremiobacteraeota bacterium]|nr:AbrB/MazE/SpoVT family DNA-binding domain-containing protein [Candidatus Eremiobacteraeota bacterium]
MNAKVARYGNSLTVRLPAAVARELGICEGDEMSLRRTARGIALERPARSRLELRLATVRGRESETHTGHAFGRELE